MAIALVAVLASCASAPSKKCYGSMYAVGDFTDPDRTTKVLQIDALEDAASKNVVGWHYHTTTGENIQLNFHHVKANEYVSGLDPSVSYVSGGMPKPSYMANAEDELMRFYSEDDYRVVKAPAEFMRLRTHAPIVVHCPVQ